MSNFAGTTPSLNKAFTNQTSYGELNRTWLARVAAATTAANTTSGYLTIQRYSPALTLPSVGSGVAGFINGNLKLIQEDASKLFLYGIEYSLGTLTVSGNSFSAGSSMPSKTVAGSSITTASIFTVVHVDTTLGGATTPTLTITYTDQAGNTGNSCSMTLPSNPAAQSCFWMQPHLASGDTGVRAVTNMSISAGTSGALRVYGILPLGFSSDQASGTDIMTLPLVPFTIQASEALSIYGIGTTTTTDCIAMASFMVEDS